MIQNNPKTISKELQEFIDSMFVITKSDYTNFHEINYNNLLAIDNITLRIIKSLAKLTKKLSDQVEDTNKELQELKNKFDFYEKCINAMEKDAIIQTLEFCEKYSDKKYTGDRTNLKECQAFIDENLDEAGNLYDEYLRHTPTM